MNYVLIAGEERASHKLRGGTQRELSRFLVQRFNVHLEIKLLLVNEPSHPANQCETLMDDFICKPKSHGQICISKLRQCPQGAGYI